MATDDSATTEEGTSVTVNVLDGSAGGPDSDVDGDTLTILDGSTTSPSNGNVTLSTGDSFVYTPSGNFNGQDSFVYTISDGTGLTATATGKLNNYRSIKKKRKNHSHPFLNCCYIS